MLGRTLEGTKIRADRPLSRLGRLHSSAGFTIAELIVVIVMVGLLAATAAVKFGNITSTSNLRTAMDQVAADLRFLQCRTIANMSSTGATYTNTASFPAGANTYFLGGQVKNLPVGVTINNGLNVTFNSLGEYQTNANGTITLNSRGVTGSIKIYAVSGEVETY